MEDNVCGECGKELQSQQGKRQHYTRVHRESSTVGVTCSWCGSDFEKNHRHVDSAGDYDIDNHFCDKECESEYKSEHWVGEDHPSYDGGHEEVVCEECGNTYEVKPSVVDKTRFCSRDCQRENWTEPVLTRECGHCGGAVERKAYEIKGDDVFCDDECFSQWLSDQRKGDANPQWRGGKELYYGPNWNEQRSKALYRDGYACQLCGRTRSGSYDEYGRDLEVHHRVPIRLFDDNRDANDLSNLVTLCSGCHKDIEHRHPVPHNDLRAPA